MGHYRQEGFQKMVRKAHGCADLRRHTLLWVLPAQERQVDRVAVPAGSCTSEVAATDCPGDRNAVSAPHPGDASGAILTIDGYDAGN